MFELRSPQISDHIPRTLVHDLAIDRRLYDHSQAWITLEWDETHREGDRPVPTAQSGAGLIDAELALIYRGRDLTAEIECFRGYVERVSAGSQGTRARLVLHAASHSKRTDLIPRFRVWQAGTLLDICQHIAAAELLVQIAPEARQILARIEIDLSVQYDETDFAYLRRLLHAWGIPLLVDDRAGKLVIGDPAGRGAGVFPDTNWHWETIALEGELGGTGQSAGAGPTGTARRRAGEAFAALPQHGSRYFPRLDDDHEADRRWIEETVARTAFRSGIAAYRLAWQGGVFDYGPGDAVAFAGQDYLIHAVAIHSGPDTATATQEFVLQDSLVPLAPHRRRAAWPGRMLWARVTRNDEDPYREGRIQVAFDCGLPDPTGENRCWLPTLTPYGGLKGKEGTSGLLTLPEVGERVLVQFLGDWDSDAVVVGSVREFGREGFVYDADRTKRWRTPSGNQIAFTTDLDGSDTVQLRCQDKLIFEGKISGDSEEVLLDLCGSEGERIHFQKGAGPARLDIFCSGEIYMHAGQKLLLEGGAVQIKSTAGPVTIDGAPMVQINCGPWSLSPLEREETTPQESSPKRRPRARPPQWTRQVSPSAAGAAQEKKKTFLEIALVDDEAKPVPGERYVITLPDGSRRAGTLDANGRARVEGIDPGTAKVTFPDRDGAEWKGN